MSPLQSDPADGSRSARARGRPISLVPGWRSRQYVRGRTGHQVARSAASNPASSAARTSACWTTSRASWVGSDPRPITAMARRS